MTSTHKKNPFSKPWHFMICLFSLKSEKFKVKNFFQFFLGFSVHFFYCFYLHRNIQISYSYGGSSAPGKLDELLPEQEGEDLMGENLLDNLVLSPHSSRRLAWTEIAILLACFIEKSGYFCN
jgi:hypothetical protein